MANSPYQGEAGKLYERSGQPCHFARWEAEGRARGEMGQWRARRSRVSRTKRGLVSAPREVRYSDPVHDPGTTSFSRLLESVRALSFGVGATSVITRP